MIGLTSLLHAFGPLSLALGERVVSTTDLVAALGARGYPAEVVRVGMGLESKERRNTSNEEPRCGLGGYNLRSSTSMLTHTDSVFRGVAADNLVGLCV